MSEAWKVLPHQRIEKLTSNLWRVEGNLPNMALKRVMTVAKLTDGRLVIHNAMALEEDAMQEIERWGEVAFVLVPNGYHRIDAPRFAVRYPHAKVLCPEGSKKAVLAKVRVDGGYDALPRDEGVEVSLLKGVGNLEGRMVVKSEEGTSLVLNDAVFNMPHEPGVTGLVLKHITQSTGGPRVSRIARLFMVKDKRAFAEGLNELAALPELRRIIVSHHQVIEDVPSETLRAVASTL